MRHKVLNPITLYWLRAMQQHWLPCPTMEHSVCYDTVNCHYDHCNVNSALRMSMQQHSSNKDISQLTGIAKYENGF